MKTKNLIGLTAIIILSLILSSTSIIAVEVEQGTIFCTYGSQCNYHSATNFTFDNISVYPTNLFINNGNISTYPTTDWVNVSIETLSPPFFYFTNNVSVANITINNGFSSFYFRNNSIYKLQYQSNETIFSEITSSNGKIIFENIPSNSWFIQLNEIGVYELTNAINTHSSLVSASENSNIITLTANQIGNEGNKIRTTENILNASFSSEHLTGAGDEAGMRHEIAGTLLSTISIIGIIVMISLFSLIFLFLKMNSMPNIQILVPIGIAIAIIFVIFAVVIPQIGEQTETVSYGETYATGTLTFTGQAIDGEKVIIGAEVYEFDTNDSIDSGSIRVDIS